jgi:hypothetical protein
MCSVCQALLFFLFTINSTFIIEPLYHSYYNNYTMKEVHLSQTFIQRIRNTYHEAGVQWLEELSFLLVMIGKATAQKLIQ